MAAGSAGRAGSAAQLRGLTVVSLDVAWSDPADAIGRALRSARGMVFEAAAESLSWPELAQRIAAIDDGLSKAGIGPGETVAVTGRGNIDSAAVLLALVATRRGAAIINPSQSGSEVLAAARAVRANAILLAADDPALGAAGIDEPLLVITRGGQVIRHGNIAMRPAPTAGDRRLSLGTSGTTGKPKQIDITSHSLSRAMAEITRFNAGFGDKPRHDGTWAPLIQYSPLAHIGGALTVVRAAVQGRGTVLLGKFDPERWADVVEEHGLLTTGLPPTMMRMVLDAGIAPHRLASLVSVWSGTAPARAADWDAFTQRYGLPILGNYGATEFCGAIAAWSLDDYRSFYPERRNAVGRLHPSVASARIRDADGNLCHEPDAVGTLEVLVHRISPGWQATSDLASIDNDGFLTLHGRADDAIIRGGFKLSPEKIAAILMKHPAVREAAVVGSRDDRLGQVPVAAVEIRDGSAVEEDELKAFVRDRLPAYFVPAAIRLLSALPRTASMKVDRKAVRALFSC